VPGADAIGGVKWLGVSVEELPWSKRREAVTKAPRLMITGEASFPAVISPVAGAAIVPFTHPQHALSRDT
jgi:hypothetical protein